jgi:AcrR family transcriptional regulator
MGKKPRKPKRKIGSGPPTPDHVIDAALALAAAGGWRQLGLAGIAGEAGLTLAELRSVFPSKAAILAGFVRRTDERVLAGGGAGSEDGGGTARDRLFDVLMRRFDVLQTDRSAVRVIIRDSLCDPLAVLCQGPMLLCSMASMLEAAGLSSTGLNGALRTKGLALVYLVALRAWLKDDSTDLAKTMAALDRGLRQAEKMAAFLNSSRTAKAGRPKEA